MTSRTLTDAKHLAWAALRVFCGRTGPWLARWFGRAYADRLTELQPGYLVSDSYGVPSLVDQLAKVPAGGKVIIPTFFVGTPIRIPFGDLMLWSVSRLYMAEQTAANQHARLKRVFPSSAVMTLTLYYDPANPQHRKEIDKHQRDLVREVMGCPR